MSRSESILSRFTRYFFQGVLIFAPTALSIYIVYLFVTYVDGLLSELVEQFVPFSIPGLGLVAAVVFITVFGFIGQSIIFKPFRILIDRVMQNVPLVKVLYSALRDLFSAFVGSEKKFNKPVLVKVNTISDLEKIGFITKEDLTELNIKDKVAVYFPHSYNFSGEMFIVPKDQIKPLNIPASDAMKFIVSGGVTQV